VAEGSDAKPHHVRALPETIRVDEPCPVWILHSRVRTAHVVARRFERLEGFAHPPRLRGPVRNWLRKAARALQQVSADRRVERQLHLIDGDAVCLELQRAVDTT